MKIEKALVVDDSKVAHLTLRKLLTERRIEVDWVGSGEDAIAYMQKQQPDIIFMDVMMPGMDGFETTHAITNNPAITAPPVIICSANSTDEDKQNAQCSGAIGFLSKPYTPAQMDQVLTMVRGLSAPAMPKIAAPVESTAPPSVRPTAAHPAAPAPVTRSPAPAPVQAVMAAADLERSAGEIARAVAEKVAREVAQATVQQAARPLAEEAGRKAAQAAVQAALEAAKKAAVDIARVTANEAARTVSEKVAREVSQDAAHKAAVRGLAEGREDLLRRVDEQVANAVRDALARALAGKEFKQQLAQIAKEAILPKAEAAAQEALAGAVQNSAAPVADALKQAKLATTISIIATIVAVGALTLHFLL